MEVRVAFMRLSDIEKSSTIHEDERSDEETARAAAKASGERSELGDPGKHDEQIRELSGSSTKPDPDLAFRRLPKAVQDKLLAAEFQFKREYDPLRLANLDEPKYDPDRSHTDIYRIFETYAQFQGSPVGQEQPPEEHPGDGIRERFVGGAKAPTYYIIQFNNGQETAFWPDGQEVQFTR
jgi:hypothetical protein